MKINEIIRAKRREQGMTQEQAAAALGVSASAVHKWEKGSSYPDITLLPALARLLGVDLNTLLSFQEDLTPEEIGRFCNGLVQKVKEEGISAGFEMAMEKISGISGLRFAAVQHGGYFRRGAYFVCPGRTGAIWGAARGALSPRGTGREWPAAGSSAIYAGVKNDGAPGFCGRTIAFGVLAHTASL